MQAINPNVNAKVTDGIIHMIVQNCIHENFPKNSSVKYAVVIVTERDTAIDEKIKFRAVVAKWFNVVDLILREPMILFRKYVMYLK